MSLGQTATVFSVQGRESGLYYVEIGLENPGGLFDISSAMIGLTAQPAPVEFVAPSADGIGAAPSGGFTQYSDFLEPFGSEYFSGDTVRIAVNLNTGLCWFGVNGQWLGDPEAGTGAVNDGVPLTVGAPYLVFATTGEASIPVGRGYVFTLRAQPSQFLFEPPAGFLPWES